MEEILHLTHSYISKQINRVDICDIEVVYQTESKFLFHTEARFETGLNLISHNSHVPTNNKLPKHASFIMDKLTPYFSWNLYNFARNAFYEAIESSMQSKIHLKIPITDELELAMTSQCQPVCRWTIIKGCQR